MYNQRLYFFTIEGCKIYIYAYVKIYTDRIFPIKLCCIVPIALFMILYTDRKPMNALGGSMKQGIFPSFPREQWCWKKRER
jgi:hypothetical protein